MNVELVQTEEELSVGTCVGTESRLKEAAAVKGLRRWRRVNAEL